MAGRSAMPMASANPLNLDRIIMVIDWLVKRYLLIGYIKNIEGSWMRLEYDDWNSIIES